MSGNIPAPNNISAPAPNATPTPTPTPAPTPTPDPAPTGNWYDGFAEDLKGYVVNKQFKDPSVLADSYRNLEKLMGVPQERLLKLPEKADAPEWEGIYKKLGKPDKVEGYKIDIPKEYGDENFAKAASDAFHKANLSQAQAKAITDWWSGQVKAQMDGAKAAQETELKNQTEALKKEWGAAFEQNFNAVDSTIDKLGISEEQLVGIKNAMGAAGAAKFLYGLSSKLGEHAFESGSRANSVNTPAGAKAMIDAKKADPEFRNKLLNRDAEAVAEWDRLHRNLAGAR